MTPPVVLFLYIRRPALLLYAPAFAATEALHLC